MSDVPTSKLRTEQLDRLDAALDARDGGGGGGGGAGSGGGGHPLLVGRYRVLERLGEGGMGAVYRAEQRTPIERIVALKLIRPGLDDTPEIVRRFGSERQALARMDHPNIAKVLDAGADPGTGQPYFVMEYVAGLPITRYCDEHRLSTRQRLALFLQVCDAVAHAHQKMIVHRDLKPSNVLVRSDNGPATAQVKVIDFGIAKALVSSSAERAATLTGVGDVVGTLDYMSPEQARGTAAHQDVDTRSDIYSMGVLLYELLTGALPFDPQKLRSAGLSGIERMICEVDPPRPSTRLGTLGDATGEIARRRQTQPHELARELARELEWIPLKAMRKERAARYATAAELAEDVRNYLAGRPLRAAPESRLYRARKFLRRNRVAVSVAALVVLLLVAGIAGTTWQAARAQRQRRLAESRFDDVRHLAADLIFDIHGDVAKLAGSQPAVDKLLAVALQYLQKLEADSSDNFEVVRDAAHGYGRLGDLQGNQYANNRDDPAAARASYLKARELARRAVSMRPGDVSARRALAGAEVKLGDVAQLRADDASARAHYVAAQRIIDQLAAEMPHDYRARADVVLAAQRVATRETGAATADLLTLQDQIVELARRLVADFPGEQEATSYLATALQRAYPWKLQAGDFAGALAAAREAADLRERLAADRPDDVDRHVLLAVSLQNVARALSQQEKADEALATQQRCLDVATRLYQQDAANARVRATFANAQVLYGDLAADAGKVEAARAAYETAIAAYRASLERAGSNRDAFRMMLYALSALGDLLAKHGDRPAALARHREAIALLEPAAAAQPDDAALVGGLAFVHARVGKVLMDGNDNRGAVEPLARAVQLNGRLAAADPANAMIGWNLVEARAQLGDAYAACGSAAEAAVEYAAARDLARALQQKNMRGANETAVESLDAKLAALNGAFPATAPGSQPATPPAAAPR